MRGTQIGKRFLIIVQRTLLKLKIIIVYKMNSEFPLPAVLMKRVGLHYDVDK